MCPVCITTAALMASGAGSLGGLSLFVMKRIRANTDNCQTKETDQCPASHLETHGSPRASNC